MNITYEYIHKPVMRSLICFKVAPPCPGAMAKVYNPNKSRLSFETHLGNNLRIPSALFIDADDEVTKDRILQQLEEAGYDEVVIVEKFIVV